MHDIFNQLLIFRDMRKHPVLKEFGTFISAKERSQKIDGLFEIQYAIINDPILEGVSWKETIVDLVLYDENPFTLKAERGERIDDDLISLVSGDIHILRTLYQYDWDKVLDELDINRSTIFTLEKEKLANEELHRLLENNSTDERLVVKALYEHIHAHGTGMFSKDFVFKWDDEDKVLCPIKEFDAVKFADLIGYERQIGQLKENTEHFIRTGKGNNVLLYGQRGTGKSSSVKALVHEYANEGLRVIEIKKRQVDAIVSITERIRNRNYKYILFIDDLSFEEFEVEYKHFKAVMEGSFEKRPDNMLIYVTSNRRHLIRETFKEREEDVNANETLQEKISLFDRFGLTILYDQPKDELYNEMVIKLAKRNGIDMPEEELLQLANEWKTSKASKSGRAAQQLVDSLSSEA